MLWFLQINQSSGLMSSADLTLFQATTTLQHQDAMASTFETIIIHDNCSEVCCAGFWMKEHFPESFDCSLSNDLHPLFRKDRFKASKSGTFDQKTTLPLRRFDSRMVSTDCLMPFWYNILFGKTKTLTSWSGEPRFEIEEPPKVLTAAQLAEVRSRLVQLA